MKNLITKVSIITASFIPSLVSAQEIKNPLGNLTGGKTGEAAVSAVIGAIVELMINVGTIVVVLFIVYAGYKFVTANGNPEKLNEAKSILLWTVVGAIVLIGANTISQVIQETVGPLK